MNIAIKNLRKEKPNNELDIRVDRGCGSPLGNPFYMKNESERDKSCDDYEKYFYNQVVDNPNFRAELDRLINIYKKYGKLNLFCWCFPKRCHAETIQKFLGNEIDI